MAEIEAWMIKPNEVYIKKRRLIDEIKKIFGPDCIKDNTYDFKSKNLIIFQDAQNEVILDYHFSNEIYLFGADVDFIDYVTNLIENDNISKTKGDKYLPQYRFNIVYERGKYWLRLKNNQLEDISVFQTIIKDLLNQNLINRYEEEKERYFSTKKDKEELLRKLVK
ncbi:hypothetical protein HYY70_06175 [Candidatus Woesearchaeota archaeon]|nr:hypothetical protein [Candidatus Woesearchaeota archaeon]